MIAKITFLRAIPTLNMSIGPQQAYYTGIVCCTGATHGLFGIIGLQLA